MIYKMAFKIAIKLAFTCVMLGIPVNLSGWDVCISGIEAVHMNGEKTSPNSINNNSSNNTRLAKTPRGVFANEEGSVLDKEGLGQVRRRTCAGKGYE